MAGIYFANEMGDLFFVSRNDTKFAGGFRTKIITHAGGQRDVELIWRDSGFALLGSELDPADTYDPSTRPWYKKVLTHNSLIWTSPYIFFTSRKPGETVAGPALYGEGRMKGIVGVDIDIAELSAFIGELGGGARTAARS